MASIKNYLLFFIGISLLILYSQASSAAHNPSCGPRYGYAPPCNAVCGGVRTEGDNPLCFDCGAHDGLCPNDYSYPPICGGPCSSNCDPDCPGIVCKAPEVCTDGIDNDCDGSIDGADSDCAITLTLSPNPTDPSTTVTATTTGQISGTVTIKDWLGCSDPAALTICTGSSCTFTSPTSVGLYGYNACTTSGQQDNEILNVRDTTPPVRSNGAPTGTLAAGTTSATLSLNTNENANCRYATASGTSYASMASTFSSTGGTSHSNTVSGLLSGVSYTYYVRCSDSIGNANTDDYTISFSVSKGVIPVTLEAIPPSGTEPLTATLYAVYSTNLDVSGRSLRYRFDCTNDGIYEVDVTTTGEKSYTTLNACTYNNIGTYTAKVRLEESSDGYLVGWGEATAIINVETCTKSGSAQKCWGSCDVSCNPTTYSSPCYRLWCRATDDVTTCTTWATIKEDGTPTAAEYWSASGSSGATGWARDGRPSGCGEENTITGTGGPSSVAMYTNDNSWNTKLCPPNHLSATLTTPAQGQTFYYSINGNSVSFTVTCNEQGESLETNPPCPTSSSSAGCVLTSISCFSKLVPSPCTDSPQFKCPTADTKCVSCNSGYSYDSIKKECVPACKTQGQACSVESDCCNPTDNYCASGGRCCPKGFFWDNFGGLCRQALECGLKPDRCNSNILKDFRGWLNNPKCRDPEIPIYRQTCVVSSRYGLDGRYYYTDVKWY